MSVSSPIELVCPMAASRPLKTAIDHGADCVYLGFKDATNARNFSGLNFDPAQVRGCRLCARTQAQGIGAQHLSPDRQLVVLDTGDRPRRPDYGVDAVILADPGLMAYAAKTHPKLRLHLSVQGSATSYEAINWYRERFGIQRAVLPRVLSMAQVESVVANTPVEIEIFGFGGLCVMVEGAARYRPTPPASLPTATAPARRASTCAGKTPARHGDAAQRHPHRPLRRGRARWLPDAVQGRFEVNDETYYALEEPTSLNTLESLPELARIGIRAIKIEGRQRVLGLRRPGHQGVACRARQVEQRRRRRFQRAAGVDGRAQQGLRRPEPHPRRLLPPVE